MKWLPLSSPSAQELPPPPPSPRLLFAGEERLWPSARRPPVVELHRREGRLAVEVRVVRGARESVLFVSAHAPPFFDL
eukprot:3275257-Pleurochrysis_carterae.AAC.1